MAYKKMFTSEVLLGDALFNLSSESFKLFVLLTLRCDADGLVLADRSFYASTGTSETALADLINADLVYQFPDQVCVILDFFRMNRLDHQSKYYKPTKYREDFGRLELIEGRYEVTGIDNIVLQSPSNLSSYNGDREIIDLKETKKDRKTNMDISPNNKSISPVSQSPIIIRETEKDRERVYEKESEKDSDADSGVDSEDFIPAFSDLSEKGKIYAIIGLYPDEVDYGSAYIPIFQWTNGRMRDNNGVYRSITFEQIYLAVGAYVSEMQSKGVYYSAYMPFEDLLKYENLKHYVSGKIEYSGYNPKAEFRKLVDDVMSGAE